MELGDDDEGDGLGASVASDFDHCGIGYRYSCPELYLGLLNLVNGLLSLGQLCTLVRLSKNRRKWTR